MAITNNLKTLYPIKTFPERKASATKLITKFQKNGTLSDEEKTILLKIVVINYHDIHKIAGAYSCDSSAHNCEFCKKMQKAAENNPAHICGYCYDMRQENRMPSVMNAHTLNLFILSVVPFSVEDWKRRPITKKLKGFLENFLRINSAGETENQIHAENMINLIYANPRFHSGYWGKNYGDIGKGFDHIGKPKNCRYVQSSPIIGKPAKRSKWADLVFTVYPDEESLQKALDEGGVECNGKMCAQCGWKCYLPPELGGWPDGSNVCELLRISNKKDASRLLTVFKKIVAIFKK